MATFRTRESSTFSLRERSVRELVREVTLTLHRVTCPCGVEFEAKHPRAKWHSDACRKRAARAEVAHPTQDAAPPAPDPVAPAPGDQGPVEVATRHELEQAGKLQTTLGQACVVLARRLDRPHMESGSGLATLANGLSKVMAAATKGSAKSSSPAQLRDEVGERRKRRGG